MLLLVCIDDDLAVIFANSQVAGTNVQSFTGTLGGAAPPVISSAGNRPFSVNGSTFINAGAALIRSCGELIMRRLFHN